MSPAEITGLFYFCGFLFLLLFFFNLVLLSVVSDDTVLWASKL